MLQLIRLSPGLLVWLILFSVAALVGLSIGAAMYRAGASLRPIFWFAGLLLLIGAPQCVWHGYVALTTLKTQIPQMAALQTWADFPVHDARSRAPSRAQAEAARRLWGDDGDAALVVDAKPRFPEALAHADHARLASLPGGESVLIASFAETEAAEQAWFRYLQSTGLNALGGEGDSHTGYAVTRLSGDRIYAVPMGLILGVWIGPDDAAIRARMAAGGFRIPFRAPLALHGAQPAISPVTWIASGVLLNTLLVIVYFFKGAAWAGSVPGRDRAPMTAVELMERLQAVNTLDVPFRIERDARNAGDERDNVLIATWRYADAKWIDLAGANAMNRLHRIVLQIDEPNHRVLATDYASASAGSIGKDGATIEWQASLGITFFQAEHQQVLGLQIDDHGRFTRDSNYRYAFNLDEMKNPLIRAVTDSGWTWRPVVWQGPAWLRWLTV
jgi:hypothetical protein